MPELSVEDVRQAIMRGDFNHHQLAALKNIVQNAIAINNDKSRREFAMSLRAGSKVEFNNKARPVYMQGATATVLKINKKTASVMLDRPHGRFHGEIRAPLSILSVLTDES